MFKNSTLTTTIASLLGLTSLGIANPVDAAILNGSFENDLIDWMISGDVSIQETFGDTNPTNGSKQVLLTNAFASPSRLVGDDSSFAGEFNFSGNDPTNAQFPFTLQNFLGLSPTALNSPFSSLPAFEGSAIKQTFTANEGDKLNFEAKFLTNDGLDFFGNPRDYAFVTLYQVGSTPNSIIPLASSTDSLTSSNSVFNQETGSLNFTSDSLTAGEYILGIGVVDVLGTDKTSALLVDNVRLTPTSSTTKVPEPGFNLGLLMLGIFGSGLILKRKI